MKETREENHMAKTHRSITYISVLFFFELIGNYIYIFWGLFGIHNVIFFVVNSSLSRENPWWEHALPWWEWLMQ